MTELVTAANHAAQQNDRWMFIVTLIVLGAFAYFVTRHLVKQNERMLENQSSARDSYQASLKEVVAAQNQITVDVTEALTRNTEVIKNCGQVMQGCTDEMRLCREHQNQR